MDCNETRRLIHAYLDGELDLVRSLEIEEHLRACPACTQEYKNQQALRAALDGASLYFAAPPGLERRIRGALREAGKGPASRRVLPWRWLSLAAAAACVLLVGWGLGQALAGPAADAGLGQAVLAAHLRSLQPGHLTDVESTDQHTVKPWFDGKLDFAPPVVNPAAQGFPLLGGRLDYLDGRPVAALVYGRQKHLINVFIWPAPGATSGAPHTETRQGYNLVSWTAGGMTYWVVSDLNAAELGDFVRLLQP